jgi:hypothetical protein
VAVGSCTKSRRRASMGHGEHRRTGPQEQRVSDSRVGPEVGTCGRYGERW